MDLTITRDDAGGLSTRTFRKRNCRPQMLDFLSAHPASTKWNIFKNEAKRHLLNCSSQADYEAELDRLVETMTNKGYPVHLFQRPRYDSLQRNALLKKLSERRFTTDPQPVSSKLKGGKVIMKLPFVDGLKHRPEFKESLNNWHGLYELAILQARFFFGTTGSSFVIRQTRTFFSRSTGSISSRVGSWWAPSSTSFFRNVEVSAPPGPFDVDVVAPFSIQGNRSFRP